MPGIHKALGSVTEIKDVVRKPEDTLFSLNPWPPATSQNRSWNAWRKTSLPTDWEWPLPEGEGGHKFILTENKTLVFSTYVDSSFHFSVCNKTSPSWKQRCLCTALPTSGQQTFARKVRRLEKGPDAWFHYNLWFWVEGVWESNNSEPFAENKFQKTSVFKRPQNL